MTEYLDYEITSEMMVRKTEYEISCWNWRLQKGTLDFILQDCYSPQLIVFLRASMLRYADTFFVHLLK